MECIYIYNIYIIGSLLATISALIIGLGIGSAFGFIFNPIVLLIPFILLGVAVDDDIIIVETLDITPFPDNDIEKQDIRTGNALRHAGVSITLTSFSSVLAFAIGSLTDIPGISSFCAFGSLCFMANYGMFICFFTYINTKINCIFYNHACIVFFAFLSHAFVFVVVCAL